MAGRVRQICSALYAIFHFFDKTTCNPINGTQCTLCRDSGECGESPEPRLEKLQANSKVKDMQLGNLKVAIDHVYDANIHDERVWTLTHSYFANMGGLSRHHGELPDKPITAHALVNNIMIPCHPLPSPRGIFKTNRKLTGL